MTAIRDFLMRMEGMEANVEDRPTPKQWATIVQWIADLRREIDQVPAMGSLVSPMSAVAATQVSPNGNGGDATDILAQVASIKKAGAAGSHAQFGPPQAMDAAPPPSIRRK